MELAFILLAAGLFVSALLMLGFAWREYYRPRMPHVQEDQQWECSGFDVSQVAQRVERLRADYVGELHAQQCSRTFHDSLLAAARQTVARLPFFSSRRTDEASDESENHAALQ